MPIEEALVQAQTNTELISKRMKKIKKIIHSLLGVHTNAMSFQNSMDLAELPVVTFYQGDKKINFLLDTGANNCVIDSSFLSQLKYQELDTKTNFSGIEGNSKSAKVCLINMSYKDNNYEFPYVIQDLHKVFGDIKKTTGVTVHGLLGSSFFNKFDYVLDFKELIAYSKK